MRASEPKVEIGIHGGDQVRGSVIAYIRADFEAEIVAKAASKALGTIKATVGNAPPYAGEIIRRTVSYPDGGNGSIWLENDGREAALRVDYARDLRGVGEHGASIVTSAGAWLGVVAAAVAEALEAADPYVRAFEGLGKRIEREEKARHALASTVENHGRTIITHSEIELLASRVKDLEARTENSAGFLENDATEIQLLTQRVAALEEAAAAEPEPDDTPAPTEAELFARRAADMLNAPGAFRSAWPEGETVRVQLHEATRVLDFVLQVRRIG